MKKTSRRPAPLNRAGKIYVAAHILIPLAGIPIAAYFILRSKPADNGILVFPAIIAAGIVVYVIAAIRSARGDPRFTTGTFTTADARRMIVRGIAETALSIMFSGSGSSSSSSGASSMSGGSSGSW